MKQRQKMTSTNDQKVIGAGQVTDVKKRLNGQKMSAGPRKITAARGSAVVRTRSGETNNTPPLFAPGLLIASRRKIKRLFN